MRAAQRGQYLKPDAGRGGRVERAVLLHYLAQGPGLDQLHDDPGAPVVLGHVVDRDDVRMTEPGRGTRFPQRPLAQRRALVRGHPGGREDLLGRDPAAQQLIPGQPYRAHASAAQRLNELVAPGDNTVGTGRSAHSRRIPRPRESKPRCGPATDRRP
jgi:hypothetical protein